jgi:DNA-binding response OmpR family regulator
MRSVLLVEDDHDQLEVRSMLLEAAGHRVAGAASAAAAYEAFCRSEPEVVIMDLRLPRTEDGLALIRRMRERSEAVRIIVLSGCPSDLTGLPESALVDSCLMKPARSRQLLDLIG